MALTADAWAPGGRAVTLLADAFATRIETSGGTASGVTYRRGSTGEVVREDAKVVVLAAGAVESPRLWLKSSLPNPNDWVGRGLTHHFLDVVAGRFAHYTGSSKGPASAARADFPGRGGLEEVGVTPGLQAQTLATSDAGIAGIYDNGAPGGSPAPMPAAGSSASACSASSPTSTG